MSENPSNHRVWEVDPTDPSPTEAVERLVGLVNGYEGHGAPMRLTQFGNLDADNTPIRITDPTDAEFQQLAYTLDVRNLGTGSRALRVRANTNAVLLKVTDAGIVFGTTVVGPVTVSGQLNVTDLNVGNNLTVTNHSALKTLTASGAATLQTSLTVHDQLTLGSGSTDYPSVVWSSGHDSQYAQDKLRLATVSPSSGVGIGVRPGASGQTQLVLYSPDVPGSTQAPGQAGIVVAKDSAGGDGWTVWHAGNDGAGSGLDADTLDGVQGSSYLQAASANLLYVQKTGDIMTGALTLTNDLIVRTTVLKTTSTGVGVNTTPNVNYKLDVNGATRLFGKVGINTDTDSDLELNVLGDAKISGRAGIGGGLISGVALAVTGKARVSDEFNVLTNKLSVTSNGVGVDTTADGTYKLRVSGSADITNDVRIQKELSAATANVASGKLVVTSTTVGVNTSDPSSSYNLDVDGTSLFSDGFTAGIYSDSAGSTATLKVLSQQIGINTDSPSSNYTIDAFGTFRISTQRPPGSTQGTSAERKLIRENTLKLRTDPYIKLSDQEVPAKFVVYTEQDDGQLNTFLEIRKNSMFVGTRAGYASLFSSDYVLDVIGNTRIRANSGTDKITLFGDMESVGKITIKGTTTSPRDLTLDSGDIMLTDGDVFIYRVDSSSDKGNLNVEKDGNFGGKLQVTDIIRGFSYIRASNRIGFALHTAGQDTQSTWNGYVKAQRLSGGTWYNIKIPFLYDPNSNSTD